MSKYLLYKKKLIVEVFEKAKKNTLENSFSGILKDLEVTLKEDYNIFISYKTFETYYKTIVQNNLDYNIKPIILDELSRYLEYGDFKNFCDRKALVETSSVKINVDGNEESHVSRNFSDIIINITNSPIFTIPEFVSKNKNGFGLIGILLAAGIFFNKTDIFSKKENEVSQAQTFISSSNNDLPPISETPKNQQENNPKIIFISDKANDSNSTNVAETIKKMDCMYWNDVEYIPVYCDENAGNFQVIQRNEETLKMKKITRADTLTSENALGKVWYDKSNNRVEFFTNHGIHPENGKTLRNVTEHILEKYAK